MLADPKSQRFIDAFLDYWIDRHENLPVRNVVDSRFTFLNRRLADYYGIPGVKGVALCRLDLPPDSARGEFMTEASVLKVTANGTTASLVLSSKWIMGGWRDRYRGVDESVPAMKVLGQNGQPFAYHCALPVDATGVLPDGR